MKRPAETHVSRDSRQRAQRRLPRGNRLDPGGHRGYPELLAVFPAAVAVGGIRGGAEDFVVLRADFFAQPRRRPRRRFCRQIRGCRQIAGKISRQVGGSRQVRFCRQITRRVSRQTRLSRQIAHAAKPPGAQRGSAVHALDVQRPADLRLQRVPAGRTVAPQRDETLQRGAHSRGIRVRVQQALQWKGGTVETSNWRSTSSAKRLSEHRHTIARVRAASSRVAPSPAENAANKTSRSGRRHASAGLGGSPLARNACE